MTRPPDTEPKVVCLPGTPKRAVKRGDDKLADDIRKAYAKLLRCIEVARQANLDVYCSLDTSDTYGGGKVRPRQITITKGL
jgi:hypothetical protein